MPHNVIAVTFYNSNLILASIGTAIVGFITSEHWDLLLGSKGGYVLCLIALYLVWNASNRQRRRSEMLLSASDKALERRHLESLEAAGNSAREMRELFQRVSSIHVDTIKALSDHTYQLNLLNANLAVRPCQSEDLIRLMDRLRREPKTKHEDEGISHEPRQEPA